MNKLLTVVCLMVLTVSACGGGGGGESGAGGTSGTNETSGGTSPSVNPEVSLSSDDAAMTSEAISSAAVGVSQAISGNSPSSKALSQKSLEILKATGSFSGVVAGSGGGNCTLTGSGASELETNPMTFSVSGTMVCSSYITTVAAASGNVQVNLDGTISTSMSGSIKKDYSSVELSFTMNWSNMVAKVGSKTFSSVTGSYSLSIAGNYGVLTITENGTIGGQSVTRTRSYTVDYTPEFETVSIYDNFDDDHFMYVDTNNYLGTYTAVDPALNTCPVNDTAEITGMTHTSLNFDVNGLASSAGGNLSSYFDFYFYTGYAPTNYCNFSVNSVNLTDRTVDMFVMLCYNYSNVKLCDAGWYKDSSYDATHSLIKSLSSSSDVEGAVNKALENLEEYNEIRVQE